MMIIKNYNSAQNLSLGSIVIQNIIITKNTFNNMKTTTNRQLLDLKKYKYMRRIIIVIEIHLSMNQTI